MTSVLPFGIHDSKTVTKKNGWRFDWKYELKRPESDVCKLTIVNNTTIIQGLISIEAKNDQFICIWSKMPRSI